MATLKESTKFRQKMSLLIKKIDALDRFYTTDKNDEWSGVGFKICRITSQPTEPSTLIELLKLLPSNTKVNRGGDGTTQPWFYVEIPMFKPLK